MFIYYRNEERGAKFNLYTSMLDRIEVMKI